MKYMTFIFLSISIFVISCSVQQYPTNKVDLFMPQSEDGNFYFEVGQESKFDPVDITVFIDDNKIVEGNYYNSKGDAHFINFDDYTFELEEGQHTIRAESKIGDVVIEDMFQVHNQTYAFIVFRDFKDTPQFIFNYQYEPFLRD